MSNLDSINNPFNIKVFFLKWFYLRNFSQSPFRRKKLKNMKKKILIFKRGKDQEFLILLYFKHYISQKQFMV